MGRTPVTNCLGQIALLKVEIRAMAKGLTVSKPTVECRYDLILDDGSRLYRAQVKYADGKPTSSSQGAVSVGLRKWRDRGRAVLPCYTADEIDLLLVYVPKIDKVLCFGPEVFDGRTQMQIRIAAARNNQVRNCLIADEYVW
jgi:hypothetical protein